ncbi:putative F-box associated interaction domain-containing protein [Helianthus annuus]|nr:putative F-box associated interaction domain-containing protein [Helianthus annuus]
MLKCFSIIGSSHGLLCLYGWFFSRKDMFVLWNISIRKAVDVVDHYEPDVRAGTYVSVMGVGVCRETSVPKIVKITHIKSGRHTETLSAISWQVVVFTLSTGAWRRSHNNPSRKSIRLSGLGSQVVVNGFLNWLATDTVVNTDGGFGSYNPIVSFDMTSEEFREVNLPQSLAHRPRYKLSISKLIESLVVLEHGVEANNSIFGVWMMEDGVPNSFTKLFTFNVNTPHASVRGFKKTGEPIIEIIDNDHRRQLVVYEPCSKRINNHNIGFDAVNFSFFGYPYVDTLLLLDLRDLLIYNNGKRCLLQQRKHKALETFK